MTKPLLLASFLLAACADGTSPKPGPMGEMGEMGTMGDMGDPGMTGAAGQSCWDLNNNRACDMTTEDTNDDNTCDVGDCIGPPGAAGSAGAAGTTGQNAVSVYGTAVLSVTPTTVATVVPGLTTTLTIPADAVVVMMTDGGVATTSTAATGYSTVDIVLAVDGVAIPNGGYKRIIAANTTGLTGMFAPWSMSATTTLAAGSHTIAVYAAGANAGSNATVSGDNTNVNQAALSVLIMKK